MIATDTCRDVEITRLCSGLHLDALSCLQKGLTDLEACPNLPFSFQRAIWEGYSVRT